MDIKVNDVAKTQQVETKQAEKQHQIEKTKQMNQMKVRKNQ